MFFVSPTLACIPGKWGVQCNETCTCVTANTEECNKATGCTCRTGWEGVDCSQDIDECVLGTDNCPVHSTCNNTYGGFTCPCDVGYTIDNNLCIGRSLLSVSPVTKSMLKKFFGASAQNCYLMLG